MSTSAAIRTHIQSMPRGRPFTSSRFTAHGPRGAVDRALSRIVREGEIERVCRGVFVRPERNRFVGNAFPGVSDVVQVIARDRGETVQVHGAEAARRFGISTQAPTTPVFHTSASSRSIRIGNTKVRLIHTANRRRLQLAGTPAGLALSALWYLGKDNVTPEKLNKIKSALSAEEFEKFRSADLPAWMRKVLDAASRDSVHG